MGNAFSDPSNTYLYLSDMKYIIESRNTFHDPSKTVDRSSSVL